MSSKLYAIAAVGFVAILLGGTAAFVFSNGKSSVDPLAQCRAGQVGGGEIGGPFTLINKDGATVTEKDVLKRPTLVYFGYTFCPDVCPLDMSRNAEVADILRGQGKDVDIVFITVDPARDTPQVVGEFAANLDSRATGLTGSVEQVTAAAKAYKVYFKLQPGDPDYYLVDHSSFTYLMLPGIGFADFYKHAAPADDVAKAASCMIDAAA